MNVPHWHGESYVLVSSTLVCEDCFITIERSLTQNASFAGSQGHIGVVSATSVGKSAVL